MLRHQNDNNSGSQFKIEPIYMNQRNNNSSLGAPRLSNGAYGGDQSSMSQMMTKANQPVSSERSQTIQYGALPQQGQANINKEDYRALLNNSSHGSLPMIN